MKIHLDIDAQAGKVTMTTPGWQTSSPLRQSLMSGYPAMVLPFDEDLYDSLEPCAIEIPFRAWRHFMRHMQRSFDYHVAHPSKWEPKTDDTTMTFVVRDVEYACEEEIPYQGQADHAIEGTLALDSGKLLVIDACYKDVAKQGLMMDALHGRWRAQVRMRDEANGFGAALFAIAHESVNAAVDLFDAATYSAEPAGRLDVDSGTCGFFDLVPYPLDEDEHEYEDGTFYHGCMKALECNADFSGVDKILGASMTPDGWGVNSRTFTGDGYYKVFVRKNETGVVEAAVLVFDDRDPVFGIKDNDAE